MKVNISTTNTKLGIIPSISLPPIITCRKDAPCTKDCYGTKGNYRFSNVQKSMQNNLIIYKTNEKEYFEQIRKYLDQSIISYKYFRWHTVGDIPDIDYLLQMIKLARKLPKTKFLAFTKQYEIVNKAIDLYGNLPKNLIIIFSAWGKKIEFINKYNLPIAHVRFKNKEENVDIPQNAKECTGNCTECLECWNIKNQQSVVFDKH